MILKFVLCLVAITFADCSNPGFKTQITQDGLNYANKIAMDILGKKIKGQTIPDQHGSSKIGGVGNVDYDFTSLSISSFTLPSSSVGINPGHGATWQATGGSFSLHGDWRYRIKVLFIPIKDSGNFDASVKDIHFTLTVTVGKDSTGRPTISATSCSADVGDVNVKFHSGASWLYNLFRHNINKAVKKQLDKIICSAALKAINENAAKSLAKLKIITKVGKDLSLDYKLTDPPIFTSKYLETSHKGEIFFTALPQVPPFSPSAMPPVESTKMLTIWLSDYIANSAGYAAFKNNLLKYTLTPKDLSPKDSGLLNTSCGEHERCFGKLVPLVQKKYPNKTIAVNIFATSRPNATIQPGKINVTFAGNLEFYVQLNNGTKPFLFSANVTMTTNVVANVSNNRITGVLQNTSYALDVMKASITNDTHVLQLALRIMMYAAVNKFVVQKLNHDLGKKGIPIPVFDDVHFVNTDLKMVKNAIQVDTDISYKPSQSSPIKHGNNLMFKPMWHDSENKAENMWHDNENKAESMWRDNDKMVENLWRDFENMAKNAGGYKYKF